MFNKKLTSYNKATRKLAFVSPCSLSGLR